MISLLPNLRRQHGVAIVTALLVVMLAASIAVFLLAQQSQSLTRTARTTARAQVGLYARPTLDWTRSLLTASLKKNPLRVSPDQDWATNVVAQPIEGALASGFLRDEQAKFNLNNLLNAGQKSQPDWQLFRNLLKQLKLDPDLANAVLDWIDKDDETSNPGGAENLAYFAMTPPRRAANVPFTQVEELLRVRGFNADALQRLAPYVTVLPGPARTRININTASPVLLLAVLTPSFSEEQVNELVRYRDAPLYFNSIDDIKKYPLHAIPGSVADQFLDIKSDFFSVTLAITGEGAQVRQQALLWRNPLVSAEWPRIIWVKDL